MEWMVLQPLFRGSYIHFIDLDNKFQFFIWKKQITEIDNA